MNKELTIMSVVLVIILGLLFLGDASVNSQKEISFVEKIIIENSSEDILIGTLTLENTGILPIEPSLPNYIACSGNEFNTPINFRRGENDYNLNTYLSPGEKKEYSMYMYFYNYRFNNFQSEDKFGGISEIAIYEEAGYSCYDLTSAPVAKIIIENE